jgi:predicted ArsR family transcriptional regulator
MAPSEDIPSRAEVDRFIIDTIDSVPHLEALLLLWQNQSQNWSVEGVAKRLWIDPDDTRRILQDLTRNQFLSLAAGEPEKYSYRPDAGNDRILRGVADIYRQEMIRISRMIHAKPSSAVRAFARAFRFTKEQE